MYLAVVLAGITMIGLGLFGLTVYLNAPAVLPNLCGRKYLGWVLFVGCLALVVGGYLVIALLAH